MSDPLALTQRDAVTPPAAEVIALPPVAPEPRSAA
jgi:hypothetical protein